MNIMEEKMVNVLVALTVILQATIKWLKLKDKIIFFREPLRTLKILKGELTFNDWSFNYVTT